MFQVLNFIVMGRKRHIDTRNLVVCDTFDEFAEKTKQCDQNVEDIVGYVTSVSRVFYWLNVESVWGVLGFTWDVLDTEGTFDNFWDRIEDVISAGKNIDGEYGELTPEEQKQMDDALQRRASKIKGGYGHFNATTLPFTIIPKLPDGYRIREFRNTFNLIESDYIEVQKSDWSNLVDINYLVDVGKSISIDITGANLNSNNKVIINNRGGNYKDANIRYTVYIKGDLINCTNGTFEYNNSGWYNMHTILLDDNNRGLNLPMSLSTSNVFYYTDKEKTFDIADWIYKNIDSPVNLQYNLYAASGKYYIDNALTNKVWNGTNSALRIFSYATSKIRPQDFTGVVKIVDPIAEEITPLNITVDCTKDGVVREDRLCGLTVGPGNFDHTDGIWNGIYTYDTQVFEPIKYIGVPTSIAMWNPFCLVKDDNSWPIYSQPIIDKLTKFDENTPNIPGINTNGINQGYFMYGAYLYINKPSPYTIDCTNIKYLNLFERARFIINDYSQFEIVGNNVKVLELVKLTNTNNLISFSVFANTVTDFYIKLPSIKTIFFCYTSYSGGSKRFYIPEGCKVEAAAFPLMWYNDIKFGKSSVPAFKVRYIDCRNYGFPYSAYFDVTTYYSPIVNDNVYNFIELEDGITTDIDFLKNCRANTTYGLVSNNKVIRHPFIVVNNNFSTTGLATNWSIESDFVFIYKANVTISHSSNYNQDMITAAYNAFEKILPGIQVNDTANTYTIKLKKAVYDLLTTAEKNHIINDLNYQLSYDL